MYVRNFIFGLTLVLVSDVAFSKAHCLESEDNILLGNGFPLSIFVDYLFLPQGYILNIALKPSDKTLVFTRNYKGDNILGEIKHDNLGSAFVGYYSGEVNSVAVFEQFEREDVRYYKCKDVEIKFFSYDSLSHVIIYDESQYFIMVDSDFNSIRTLLASYIVLD